MDLLVFNFNEWQRACYQIPSERDKYKTLVRDKYKTFEELREGEGVRGRQWGRRKQKQGEVDSWERRAENSQEIGLKNNEKRPLLLSAIKAVIEYWF